MELYGREGSRLKLSIADRVYPLTIRSSARGGVRKAAKKKT